MAYPTPEAKTPEAFTPAAFTPEADTPGIRAILGGQDDHVDPVVIIPSLKHPTGLPGVVGAAVPYNAAFGIPVGRSATVIGWFKNTVNTWMRLFTLGQISSTEYWNISYNQTSNIFIVQADTAAGGAASHTVNDAASTGMGKDGSWYQLATQINRDTEKIRVYRDGVFKAELAFAAGADISSAARLDLGGTHNDSVRGGCGRFLWFQGILSDAQILALYTDPESTRPSGGGITLIGDWPGNHHDDGGTEMLTDESGNGHHGDATGWTFEPLGYV